MSWFKLDRLFSKPTVYLDDYMFDFNFLVFKPRNNSVTCESMDINVTMPSSPLPSDSPGGTIILQPLIGFNILITFLIILVNI